MGMKVMNLDKTLARIDKVSEAANVVTEEVLAEVGEFVTDGIRNGSLSSWLDHTGNLRSSVGYAVIKRGDVVKMSDFGVILNGEEGSEKGKQLIFKLASEYSQYDYVLIIVAGEEYSVYVEAIESKAVLSEGLISIERNLPKLLKERMNKALASI